MSLLSLRIKISLIFTLLSLLAFAQRQDTIIHDYYKAKQGITLNLDFQHTNLTILPSANDSIAIHTRIRVIPTNPKAPFAGITYETNGKSNVYATITLGEDIQPRNELEASCEIHLPQHVHLKLKSRYGIVNIKAASGLLKANLSYTNLTLDTLSQGLPHHITADYSTLILNDSVDILEFTGENTNLKAKYINHLKTETHFSFFNITKVNSLKSESYTDKLILGSVDSLIINSKKSLCLINELKVFFQGEMNEGSLTIKDIKPGFEALNMSNTRVNSQLYFDSKCHFSLNADMRYCLLKQEHLTLQEIDSPNSTLYSGSYGKSEATSSNLSIISAYGDVSIHLK